jgi:hypothetical protein
MMTKLQLLLGGTLLMAWPATALAQAPLVYVCTPDGQVLEVNGSAGRVIASPGGAFDDCVVGPDGWLYISQVLTGDVAPNRIVRLDPASAAPPLQLVATLPNASAPRGLAFNVTPATVSPVNRATLFINTASSGVYTLQETGATTSPMTFPGAATPLPSSPTTPGHGLTFQVRGDMVVATGSTLRSAPAFYTAFSTLVSNATPQDVTVNTCREIVYSDKASQSLKRVLNNGTKTLVKLTKKAFPTAVETDLGNHIYFLSAEDDSGTNAILWRADPPTSKPLAQSCDTATATPIIDFKASLNGANMIPGLLSSRAKGVAIGVSSATISHTFSGECSFAYDFGHQVVTYAFDPPCAAASGITLDVGSSKTKWADVTFTTPPFSAPPATWGLRESSMGAFGIQFVLHASKDNNDITTLPHYLETYAFNTQETMLSPGLARREEKDLTLPFDENITGDVWNVDPVIGVRGISGSKHTLFNSSLAKSCVLDAKFQEPLNSNNPLFNGPQTIFIGIGATDATGNPCDGGTLHVSLMRCGDVGCENGPFAPQIVTSSVQQGNVMSPIGKGKYGYNLDLGPVDTSGANFSPVQFVITVWSDIAAPKNQLFQVSKSSK